MTKMISVIFVVAFMGYGESSISTLDSLTSFAHDNCTWRHNMTEDGATESKINTLENCLYYYLLDREAKISDYGHNLFIQPPWESKFLVKVDRFVVKQVELLDKNTNQFHMNGELFIKWHDSRLKWNSSEWKFVGDSSDGSSFALHEFHHIWTPTFTDDSPCSVMEGCMSTIDRIEIYSDGEVSARMAFRYPSYCSIDYYKYPEETNDCCLFLSIGELEQRKVEFDVNTDPKKTLEKQVAVTKMEKDDHKMTLTNLEASTWKLQDQTIDVVKVDGARTDLLRLCVHARKEMPTLKIALRIPVTIATMLMLVAPLFGDLRTQSFVKMFTLTLQTICFLFLCSIAPENGFGGTKPKIYTFYEFLFFLSFLSVVVTLVALGLSRLKRNVPPSHTLYLAAKLVNRYVCCVEPESSTSYQRYIDDSCEQNGQQRSSTDTVDYTTEWRHIYIAFNNLFSGLSFTVFIFTIIFDIL